MKETIIQFATVPLFVAVCAAGTWALHRAAMFLGAKAEESKASVGKSHLFSALAVASNCAADAVQVMESTLRPTLGQATADGKLTADEAALIKTRAIELAKQQAKACAPQILAAAGLEGDGLAGILEHLVEAAAAKYAGGSRVELAKVSDAISAKALPGPSVPAAA